MFTGVIPRFRGSALTGKHKFVPAATRATRFRQWIDWRDEEIVLKYTSQPYITVDDELDYLDSIGRRHHDIDPLYTKTLEKPMMQRYATDVLDHFEKTRQHEIW